jgi:GxxExxY protein
MKIDACYRVDLIIEDRVVVEVKSVEALAALHESQLLTYLALTECPAGLLINFNVRRLMDGVKRMLNPRAGSSRAGKCETV